MKADKVKPVAIPARRLRGRSPDVPKPDVPKPDVPKPDVPPGNGLASVGVS